MDLRIWLLAVLFGFYETAYFGWNFTPASPAEMICDGFVALLLALSFLSGRKGTKP